MYETRNPFDRRDILEYVSRRILVEISGQYIQDWIYDKQNRQITKFQYSMRGNQAFTNIENRGTGKTFNFARSFAQYFVRLENQIRILIGSSDTAFNWIGKSKLRRTYST